MEFITISFRNVFWIAGNISQIHAGREFIRKTSYEELHFKILFFGQRSTKIGLAGIVLLAAVSIAIKKIELKFGQEKLMDKLLSDTNKKKQLIKLILLRPKLKTKPQYQITKPL